MGEFDPSIARAVGGLRLFLRPVLLLPFPVFISDEKYLVTDSSTDRDVLIATGVAIGVVASRISPPEQATSSSGKKDFGGEVVDADPGDDNDLAPDPSLCIDGFESIANSDSSDAVGDDDGEPSAPGTSVTAWEVDGDPVVFGGDPLALPLLPLLLPPGLMRPRIFLSDLVPEKRCLPLVTAAMRSARVFLLLVDEGVFLPVPLVAAPALPFVGVATQTSSVVVFFFDRNTISPSSDESVAYGSAAAPASYSAHR